MFKTPAESARFCAILLSLCLAALICFPTPDAYAEEGGKKKEAEGPKAENGRIVLPKIYVNLHNEEGLRRILLLTLSLECEDNPTAESLATSKVRNELIFFLSSKSDDELLSLEGKRKLRKELIKLLNEQAAEPKVKNVFFRDFVIQ